MATQLNKAPESLNRASATTEQNRVLKSRRIYIDCTSTYLMGLNTAIQRVVGGLTVFMHRDPNFSNTGLSLLARVPPIGGVRITGGVLDDGPVEVA